MAKIHDLFKIMVAEGASDLHLRAGSPPNLRISGDMVPLNYRSLNHQECQSLIYEILTPAQAQQFENDWELDCAYSFDGLGRFRVNVFKQRLGIGAVFRLIPENIKSLDEMGLPLQIKHLINVNKGLILVTGPTGSGKSTTLASMIHHINSERRAHIITIEDPIEFIHSSRKSLINQREISSHTKSFSNALKAALREDPDILLVGEMRDLETISLAITAAETGHLVFATLHTNAAPKAVDRIIDVFPPEQQVQIRVMLSESLRGVVAQGLIKRLDGTGRVAALEILVNTHAISNLIREAKTFQIESTMQTAARQGMLTFDQSLAMLMKDGYINRASAEHFLGRKLNLATNDNDSDQVTKSGSITYHRSSAKKRGA